MSGKSAFFIRFKSAIRSSMSATFASARSRTCARGLGIQFQREEIFDFAQSEAKPLSLLHKSQPGHRGLIKLPIA